METYTITCYLDAEAQKLLSETTEIFNKLNGGNITPARLLDAMLCMGSEKIQDELLIRKDIFEAALQDKQRAQ